MAEAASVTSPVKRAIETGSDCSGLLKQRPTAADIPARLAQA